LFETTVQFAPNFQITFGGVVLNFTKNPAAGFHRAGPDPRRLYIRARLGIEIMIDSAYGEFAARPSAAPVNILAP
jgi:hypothetical protein